MRGMKNPQAVNSTGRPGGLVAYPCQVAGQGGPGPVVYGGQTPAGHQTPSSAQHTGQVWTNPRTLETFFIEKPEKP